jgi:hypothetical protein
MAYPSSPIALPDPWALQQDLNGTNGGMSVPLEFKPNTSADPRYFGQLLQNLQNTLNATGQNIQMGAQRANTTIEQMPAGNRVLASRAARYAPGTAAAIQQFPTDPMAGLATLGITAAAGKGIQALSRVVPGGFLAQGAVQLAGGLLAAPIASQLGKGVSALGNQLIGGAQAATGDVVNALTGAQREAGQSAGTGTEAGVASDKALAQQQALLYQMGVSLPKQYLTENYQAIQKYKEADKTRTMQLNQQNAVLMGQLNQQIIAGQLASGAQAQAGATTRDILTSNPYAASVLQTGGVRGI